MKTIFKLLLILYFINFYLASEIPNIIFKGAVEQAKSKCDEENNKFYFYIPASTEEVHDEETFITLPLSQPKEKEVVCLLPKSPESPPEDLTDEKTYLECYLDISKFKLYNEPFEFGEIDWNEVGCNEDNWDKFFKDDKTISKSAKCINNNYL